MKLLLLFYRLTTTFLVAFTLTVMIGAWGFYVFTGTPNYGIVENGDRLFALIVGTIIYGIWCLPLYLTEIV
jgi:hypothetical protein